MDLRDRRLDPLVRVGDDQLHAPKPSPCQLSQEVGPERLGLGGADVDPQHLPSAVRVDGDCHDHGDGDDPPVLPDLHVGRIHPEVRPVAFDGAAEKGMDPLVDLFAQTGYLALGDARHAESLREIVHRARGDALDVGFLYHCCQSLLGHLPGFEEAGKVRPLAKLGDAKLHRPRSRLPVAVAVAIALDQSFGVLLAVGGPGQRPYLQRHEPFGGVPDHLTQQVRIGRLLTEALKCNSLFGHRSLSGAG